MNNKIKPPVCLTIAGLDPSGGAGIIADIRTFSAFGCFPSAAISSVTFQNTTGVFGAVHQTADSVRRQVEPIVEDYTIAAMKTGMLPTGEIIQEVGRLIQENKLQNIVIDPVVRSTSGFDLIDDKALAVLIESLFPLSDLVTPNIPEAERIAKMEIKSKDDVEEAARIMQSAGARNVLIKGGHSFAEREQANSERRASHPKQMATDLLFLGEETFVFEHEMIHTNATHGTGCVLSAAITANLALGKELSDAVKVAKNFVHEAIRTAPGLGRGHSPINII